jgi:hypothetical protein
MLFNNLQDLIFINNNCFDISYCDVINNYIYKNNIVTFTLDNIDNEFTTLINNLETVLCEAIGKYYLKFDGKCDNFNIIKEKMLFNSFCIYTNNYIDLFDVNYDLLVYKYMICIVFLDNNSQVTFFNNYTYNPDKGDLILFPCEWFFIYKIESINKDTKNNFILNNIIKKF